VERREDSPVAKPTGELLVQRGVASPEMVERALAEGRGTGERLCSRLLAMGVDEGPLAAVLAEKHGVPGVDVSRTSVALALLELVPRVVAEADSILPLSDEGGRLHLAMADPADDRVISEVRFVTGREVSAYVAVRSALKAAIRAAYDAHDRGEESWAGAQAGSPAVASVLPHEDAVEVGDEDILAADAALPEDDGGPGLGDDEPLEVEVDAGPGGDEEVVISVRADGRRTVLVVDDEPEIRQLVQKALEHRGFAVETAVDGEQALAKAEAMLPDLVLLDAMLPKVHGFEACRRLKSGVRTRQVPVIMMTAIYRGWRFAQDAREAYGAEDYVEKPFRFDDLLRRIEAVLESTASRSRTLVEAGPALARGRELLAAHRLAEARAAFEEAIAADPYAAEAHAQLGRTLRALGDGFGAMTAYERAAELRPGSLPALRALAAIYVEKGFRRKATGALERALAAAPDEATRATIKGELLELIG
jgi:DNA-binding response OmpR family regulator